MEKAISFIRQWRKTCRPPTKDPPLTGLMDPTDENHKFFILKDIGIVPISFNL